MKRFALWSMVLVLLLSFCGCKRADDELAQTGDHAVINAAGSSAEESTDNGNALEEDIIDEEEWMHIQEGGSIEEPVKEEISAENAEKWNETDLNKFFMLPPITKKLTNNQLDGIQKEVTDDEIILRYHPDLRTNLPFKTIFSYECGQVEIKKTYDWLMEQIGENGIIVAGYTDGLREQHSKISNSYEGYTLANFVVTDQYYGPETASTISVNENLRLLVNQNLYACIGAEPQCGRGYTNGQPYLLFLRESPSSPGYVSCFDIPLSEDYRNYNETYLTDLLNFFRGDKSQYAADTFFYWPTREISDEALLTELNNNIILRTATEYEIAIWPCGHKNYTANGQENPLFRKACIPTNA